MDEQKNQQREQATKKPYVKARTEKHQAAAVVSGSGTTYFGGSGCLYSCRTIGSTYYH